MPSWRNNADHTTSRDPDGSTGALGDGGLLLVSGAGLLTTYPIKGAEIVIGRAPGCDVVVVHGALSRRHAVLRLGPPLTVQDLGSTNGTRIARRAVHGGEPVPIDIGESFQIGKLSFVVLRATRAASPATDGAAALQVLDPTVGGASALVRDVAQSEVNVLILGETGVGKEVLAETLHELSGRKGPLQRVNCAALSSTLLESELFGHEKGAFTGATQAKPGLLEAAGGGTVFLDEVGELPGVMQSKLLRALETREVLRVGSVKSRTLDVRFISATNRDLPGDVARGQFRADLFFRLDGVTLAIPRLRERPHQIGRLALAFLRSAQERQHPGKALQISPDLLSRLESHSWPGNVRELKAVIERAVLLARGGAISPSHLALSSAQPEAVPPPVAAPARGPDAEDDGLTRDQQRERLRIIEALDACAGNQTRAAQRLGVSRATLVTKLAVYRIPRPRK